MIIILCFCLAVHAKLIETWCEASFICIVKTKKLLQFPTQIILTTFCTIKSNVMKPRIRSDRTVPPVIRPCHKKFIKAGWKYLTSLALVSFAVVVLVDDTFACLVHSDLIRSRLCGSCTRPVRCCKGKAALPFFLVSCFCKRYTRELARCIHLRRDGIYIRMTNLLLSLDEGLGLHVKTQVKSGRQ